MSREVSATVRASVLSDLNGHGGYFLSLRLRYRPDSPWQVVLDLGHPTTWQWPVDREALFAGLTRPSQDGRSALSPDAQRRWLRLELSGSDASVVWLLPRDEVLAFVARTYEVVGHGTEFAEVAVVDWDAELADLLDGAS